MGLGLGLGVGLGLRCGFDSRLNCTRRALTLRIPVTLRIRLGMLSVMQMKGWVGDAVLACCIPYQRFSPKTGLMLIGVPTCYAHGSDLNTTRFDCPKTGLMLTRIRA